MSRLVTSPNLARPDEVYQWLIDLHAGRDGADSDRVNARLILLLANHVGDPTVLKEAIDLAADEAREAGRTGGPFGLS
jgi:hypothetical protein